MELINSEEFTFTVTPEMVAAESVYGAANRDNFYRAFNYFIPLHGFGADDKVTIPPNTDLMVVRQIYDFSQFDLTANYVWDNRFYLTMYNWKDENGDGNVWEDVNGNGVVNFINDNTNRTGIDQGAQLAWDDPRTELDQWEYGRYGYNRPSGNTYELSVQDPLNRNFDGIFIGLRHLYANGANLITTNLKYRVEFYQRADVNWLDTDVITMTVPSNFTAAFDAKVEVPADMPAGTYAAAIEVFSASGPDISENNIVIPVVINVAAALSDVMPGPILGPAPNALELGGMESYQYDLDTTYNNGAVRGYFDWGWRENPATGAISISIYKAQNLKPPCTRRM